MTRILVVDDEPDLETLIRQKFRKKIKESEYEFLFAENGRHALETLDKNTDIDLVLTDINMPEMDGLTLLSKLNDRNDFLKTVIVSAYGDMENIRTAMNLGAFDFITKPIDFQDLEITMVKTIKNILQLKQTAETLRENDTLKIYLKEIQAQKKLKDRFFAIISHDLRGPVSAFDGIADVMMMYYKSGKYEEMNKVLVEIKKASTDLSSLLDNLLNWASQELSQIPYNPEKIRMDEAILALINTFQHTAKSKKIEIVQHIDSPSLVLADNNSTITIFRNLVHNALKFTPEGGTVKINVDSRIDKVAISITDTGVGIPKDKLDSLFVLSDKSSTYGTNGEKGVGLGLQLVNEFTKLNQGTLDIESKEGKGTTFTVILPSPS